MASKRDELSVSLLLSVFIISCSATSEPVFPSLKKCTRSDFTLAALECDPVKRTRSYGHIHIKDCNFSAPGAFIPKPVHNVPCDCPPGQGLSFSKDKFPQCKSCPAGQYSVGGELIDKWSNWNGSISAPGSGYKLSVYCSHILTGSSCNGWQPSDDFTYLVSGSVRNATATTKQSSCLEQNSMMTYRVFVNENGQNFVGFRYKVDGMLCSRRQSAVNACTNGLNFFIDGEKRLHSDLQFKWVSVKFNLTKGTHSFRWVYQSSCKIPVSLDVAYIQHLYFTGAVDPHTKCRECPVGAYSNSTGARECTKCPAGQYQNASGQTSCLKCPVNRYSRSGEDNCKPLPQCRPSDYTGVPDPVSKCRYVKGKYLRSQTFQLPRWPGMTSAACVENATKSAQMEKEIPCICPLGGYYLFYSNGTGHKKGVACGKCSRGKFSSGNATNCEPCQNGYAAVPGIYVKEWPKADPFVPHHFTTSCSGKYCRGGGWEPAGDFIRTQRIPGNFETYLQVANVSMNYDWANVRFQCAVDCRVFPGQNRLAKFKDCFLRFTIIKDGIVIRERDCARTEREVDRNGTLQRHYYSLSSFGPGNYTFKWLFHQGDEPDSTLFSYEARIYKIQIAGAMEGAARICVRCRDGTRVSADGSLCVKCPVGYYRNASATDCTKCPAGSFTDKNGSRQCIKCGENTLAFANRTGCDINKCVFTPQPLYHYDLSPLSRPGGPMFEVRPFESQNRKPFRRIRWYQRKYFINLCTTDNGNSTCIYQRTLRDAYGKYTIKQTTILKTMACRRWSFDLYHSHSIGRVIGFKVNKTAPYGGLLVELTDGGRCYNKNVRHYVKAKTTIKMICDKSAGEGVPTPESDKQAVDKEPCVYAFKWRTVYACPLCREGQPMIRIYDKCVNGFMNVTLVPKFNCRYTSSSYQPKVIKTACTHFGLNNTPLHTVHSGLIAIIVVFFLLLGILLSVVAVLCRRNRYYRSQLFSPGTAMTQLKDADDLQELVADD